MEGAAKKTTAAPKMAAMGVKTVTLSAPKMHCAGCAAGIKSTLQKQKGVKSVEANPTTKTIVVSYVSAQQNPKTLAAALAKAGWAAIEVKSATKTVAPVKAAQNAKI